MGSKTGSGPSTMSTLTSGQKQIAGQLQSYLSGQIGQGQAAYARRGQALPIYAPLNQGLVQNASAINRFNPAAGANIGMQAVQGVLSGQNTPTLNPIQSTLTAQDTQNYIQKGLYDPALMNFNQSVVPQIQQGFAGQGATFSSRMGQAISTAGQNMMTQLGGQAANVTMQNEQVRSQQDLTAQQSNNANKLALYGQQSQNALQGAQVAGQLTSSALQNLLAQNSANWQYQNQANQSSLATYQDWLRQQPGNNPALGQAQQFIGTQMMSAYNKPPSPLMSLLGMGGGMLLGGIGGGLGAGLGSMFGGGSSMVGSLPGLPYDVG
jgi:hypothetical protein